MYAFGYLNPNAAATPAPQDPRQLQACIRRKEGGAVKISPVASVINAMVCGGVERCEKRFVGRSKDLESRAVGCHFIVFW